MTGAAPGPGPRSFARDTSAPGQAASAVVLVVDGDPVTRRFLELALAPEPRLQVECVATASAAEEVLRTTACDLVVTEARLPDRSGLELLQRIRSRRHGADLPVFVLSADEAIERKVAAFAAGADDYLVKPCPALELRARIERRVLQPRPRAAPGRVSTLAGNLATLPLPDLVGILAMNRQTATVELHAPRGEGNLFFQDGRLTHATYLSAVGAAAFYQLFDEPDVAFHLYRGCAALEVTIQESVNALIMEAARLHDTARAARGDDERTSERSRTIALPTKRQRLAPSRATAAGFARDIEDPYNQAVIELMTMNQLVAWARRGGGGARLQIAVVGTALVGAAAIASVATAPSERELAAALDRDPRCLTAGFRGRDERELDLVLIELVTGATFARGLGRRPDLVILAAPDGALLPAWPSYLELLGLLAPTVLVTTGDAAFGEAVAEETRRQGGGIALYHRERNLAHAGQLRRAIAGGLSLWAGDHP